MMNKKKILWRRKNRLSRKAKVKSMSLHIIIENTNKIRNANSNSKLSSFYFLIIKLAKKYVCQMRLISYNSI
jgi:hypothetical protein